MNTLSISVVVLFVIVALLGVYLLTAVLRNKETRKGVAFIHGPLAAVGLVALIYLAYHTHQKNLTTAAVVFAIAAVGGFTLMIMDLSGRKPPKWLALLHGLIAVIGFIILVSSGSVS